MRSFGGRPHWGKHLTLSQQDVRKLYLTTVDKFNDIRKKLDPRGIFANDFIHKTVWMIQLLSASSWENNLIDNITSPNYSVRI